MNFTESEQDKLLSTETENLIWELRRSLTDREVVQAVARARIEVRDAYCSTHLDLPLGPEYVALVMGMARRWIALHIAPPKVLDLTIPGD